MTTPTPPYSSGDKTRKQLIAILGLLVLIILLLALFLFIKMSGDRGDDSAAAEGSVSSSSESNAVVADDNGAGSSAGDDGGPNPTAGQQASGSGSGSGSSSSSSTSGTNSITGTVKVFQTKAEVLAYEQRQDPNPGSPDRGPYAILILDQPTEVTAQLSGQNGPETRTIEQAIVNPALHSDGERATITFSDDEYYWPSDPGVPFGIRLEDAPRG
ncbi:hypothetical protein [Corynebacterium amycolatum]|uniref:hypothetical protein n=1 Tax=Corynebacterium amycolatum TaxID=43765 RepID=UPI000185C058|nr:hypothetical protein [Corynebacterium amycolatum]EEB63089.1 hypothetical protein CORAM0001_1781 [Corynebacterium amycolatum SK46]